MENTTTKHINITEHNEKMTVNGSKIHVIMDGKTRYSFFETKSNGQKTKAFEQWSKFELGTGKEVDAEVKEEQKEYNGKQYTTRTILFFRADEHGTPYQAGSPITLEQRVRRLEDSVFGAKEKNTPTEQPEKALLPNIDYEDEINVDDLPF